MRLTKWFRRQPRAAAQPIEDIADPLGSATFSYPPEVADVADETLAYYVAYVERTQPHWEPPHQRYLAILLAESNLNERAAFRRELAGTLNWLADQKAAFDAVLNQARGL